MRADVMPGATPLAEDSTRALRMGRILCKAARKGKGAKKKRGASEERGVGDCAKYSGPFLEFFGVFRQLLGRLVVALRGMDLAQELQGLT